MKLSKHMIQVTYRWTKLKARDKPTFLNSRHTTVNNPESIAYSTKPFSKLSTFYSLKAEGTFTTTCLTMGNSKYNYTKRLRHIFI